MKRNFLTAGLMAVVLALPMQAGIVKGTVIDGATNKPVAGVVVSTAGGSITSTTAIDGIYMLQNLEEGKCRSSKLRNCQVRCLLVSGTNERSR